MFIWISSNTALLTRYSLFDYETSIIKIQTVWFNFIIVQNILNYYTAHLYIFATGSNTWVGVRVRLETHIVYDPEVPLAGKLPSNPAKNNVIGYDFGISAAKECYLQGQSMDYEMLISPYRLLYYAYSFIYIQIVNI